MSLAHIRKMKSERGFTIVELLIVVVIIAILAAVVVVAYTGITNQAKASKAKAAAAAVASKAEAYNSLVGNYPTGLVAGTGFDTTSAGANDKSVSLASTGLTFAALSSATPWAAPPNENVVDVIPCSTTASSNTGLQIRYWDYTKSGNDKRTTQTVGTCTAWPTTGVLTGGPY